MSSKPYHDRALARSHRKSVRRRRFNQFHALALVLGILTLTIAVGLAGWSIWSGEKDALPLSGYYGGAGLVLLLIHLGMNTTREKNRTRRSRHRARAQRLSDPTPPSSRKSGAALVLVLVILGLLATLVIQAQVSARARQRLESASLERARLETAAMDAVFHALEYLADDDNLTVDHLDESWARPVETARPDGIFTRVTIEDAQRRFDLNNLYLEVASLDPVTPQRIALDILALCGVYSSGPRLEALCDWIDPDREGRREQAFYRDRDPPSRVPNRWLASGAELFQIDGFERRLMDPHLRDDMPGGAIAQPADCITVLAGRRSTPIPVNLNTAPPAVLRGVFGVGRESLAVFVETYRRERPLRSLELLAPMVRDPALIAALHPYLSVSSNRFEVRVHATTEHQVLDLRAEVRREPEGDVQLVRWIG